VSPAAIRYTSDGIDLSQRFFGTATVAASPAAATETIIGSLTVTGDIAVISKVYLFGWAAFTVGTTGDAATLKIRQTDASGSTKASTGATNAGVLAGAQLTTLAAIGLDTAPTLPGQVYVLTLTVANAVAASTVSGLGLVAVVV